MKQIKSVLLILLIAFPLSACAELMSVTVTVVDENQNPVEDAEISMSFLLAHGSNRRTGTTNAKGQETLSHLSHRGVRVVARKEGYYRSDIRKGLGDHQVTLTLREKKTPIPMYAKNVVLNSRAPRKSGVQFGYDLLVGDFVSPYGQGIVNDLLITRNIKKTKPYYYEVDMLVEFSNPLDGLISFRIFDKYSKYKSAHSAPDKGYISKWFFEEKRSGDNLESTFDHSRNYYFRVRTKVNDNGEIESAHYGKIYGEFSSITYYFNPTPNDRNVEYDPLKNLFGRLQGPDYVPDP